MAITYTGYGDLRLAAALAQEIHSQAVDRTDLRNTLSYKGSVTGRGSLVLKVAQVAYDDPMAAANTDEVTAVSATALGTGSANITVARQAIRRDVTGQFSATGGPDLAALASDVLNAAILRVTDMVCALFSSVTASKGVAGQKLTLDDVYDAMGTVRAQGAEGPYFLVLSHTQFNNFIEALRAEGQNIHDPMSADLLALRPAGLQGIWNGIAVFACDSVAGEVGCLYDAQAFGWADGLPDLSNPALVAAPVEGNVYVEFDRDAGKGHDIMVGNYFFGVSLIEADRACKIVSGA